MTFDAPIQSMTITVVTTKRVSLVLSFSFSVFLQYQMTMG